MGSGGGCCGGFRRPFDETGHRIAWLSALAEPIFGPVEIQGEIVVFPARLIGADLLDKLAIARTAPISDHNAENRSVFGADPLHTNFNCHKSLCNVAAETTDFNR